MGGSKTRIGPSAVGQSWVHRWMSAVETQPVSMSRSRCGGDGLVVEEPMRSDCKGVQRSGVSTSLAALLVVMLEGPDSGKIACMSGRVLPSHEVQYVAVKSGEAGRSSSGNISLEVQAGREAIGDKQTGVAVSDIGGDPG